MKIFVLFLLVILGITGCSEEKDSISEGKLLSTEINRGLSENGSSNNQNYVLDYEVAGQKLLNSYSTKILTSDENRYNNISIVAERLNEYVLHPDETFSFNDICGPYGQSDGFLEAKILLSDGTETKGFGGGVCQLSSTLYNAVKDLNVTITEHHHHSAPVAYVPLNQDATVSLQSDLDFKFKNDYSGDLLFKTNHDPNNLSVSVYLK